MRSLLLAMRIGLVAVSMAVAPPSTGGDVAAGQAAFERGDYATAQREWRSAAGRGEARAQFNLGFMYASGKGVERDFEQAARWYRPAAEQGFAAAQLALGTLRLKGRGVERDPARAFDWFRRAAEGGLAAAQARLAAAYRAGTGCERSIDKAIHWYRRATEQGDIVARRALIDLLRGRGADSPEISAEAERWQREAAAAGSLMAQYELGLWLLRGDGVEKDPEEAARWLRRAAEAGLLAAQYNLGRTYWNGDGVAYDAVEAERWLGAAAAAGVELAGDLLNARSRLRDFHLRNARLMEWPRGRPVVARTPQEIRQGPPAPVPLGIRDDVHCDFFPRQNRGGNPKFRCFMMTGAKSDGGQYYDGFGNVQPRATGVLLVEDGKRRRAILTEGEKPMTYRSGFRSLALPPLELKVKYRPREHADPIAHRDMYTEVAATRLLWALRYPVDRMYRVGRVICHRCPANPFRATDPADDGRSETFDEVAIELRYGGERVERVEQAFDGGWSWRDEIWRLRYGRGLDGFSEEQKARLDGLVVLLSILRQYSGRANQNRLVCSRDSMQPIAPWKFCPETLLLVHDLGAVFSKREARALEHWRSVPVWSEPETCRTVVDFETHRLETPIPFRIGRAGQQFILELLDQLTDEHLLAVFASAEFERFDISLVEPGDRPDPERSREIVDAWISGFRDKVEEIRSVACPEQ